MIKFHVIIDSHAFCSFSGNVTMGSLATFNTDVHVTGLVNYYDISRIEKRALKIDQDAQASIEEIKQNFCNHQSWSDFQLHSHFHQQCTSHSLL